MLLKKFNDLIKIWKIDAEVYPMVVLTGLSMLYGSWVAIRKYYKEVPQQISV